MNGNDDGEKKQKSSSRQVLCVRGDVSAADACRVHSHLVSDHSAGTTTVSLLLLYGSWSALSCSASSSSADGGGAEGAKAKVDGPCQSLAGILYNRCGQRPEVDYRTCPLSVSSVRVDRDGPSEDASVDILGAPPNLPALAVVSSGDVGTEEGESGNGALQYVDIEPPVLLSCLRSTASGGAEKHHEFDRVADAVGGAIAKVVATLASRRGGSDLAMGGLPPADSPAIDDEPMIQDAADADAASGPGPGPALRIFVAGDRSQVGKSSVCLGLLGTLLKEMSYPPSSIAYIKPATQCEATQLVATYCDKYGIPNRPVGPVVYYKGFTRAFLAGETEGTEDLLAEAGRAVDDMAEGRRVVIVDGVGYPAVGSVCGTDNAAVAAACGRRIGESSQARTPVPVLLVGKSGVGDAIDSFNLNASYFESKHVPVLGSVFNRLAVDGFYSLENCKKAVTSYFDKYKPGKQPFGFIPEVPGIAKSREEGGGENATEEEDDASKGKSELEIAMDHADQFVKAFGAHVDVSAILKAAANATGNDSRAHTQKRTLDEENNPEGLNSSTLSKRAKVDGGAQGTEGARGLALTREQIEQAAKNAGAAGG